MIDSWLRELIIKLQESPITWVIVGLQKILWSNIDTKWCEIIQQKKVDGFDDKAASEYLTAKGSKNSIITENIIRNLKSRISES